MGDFEADLRSKRTWYLVEIVMKRCSWYYFIDLKKISFHTSQKNIHSSYCWNMICLTLML